MALILTNSSNSMYTCTGPSILCYFKLGFSLLLLLWYLTFFIRIVFRFTTLGVGEGGGNNLVTFAACLVRGFLALC